MANEITLSYNEIVDLLIDCLYDGRSSFDLLNNLNKSLEELGSSRELLCNIAESDDDVTDTILSDEGDLSDFMYQDAIQRRGKVRCLKKFILKLSDARIDEIYKKLTNKLFTLGMVGECSIDV